MALFRASTKITIGNGELASFWHDNWFGRGLLSLWAPNLFKIASRQNRTVAKEMSDNNWIRSVTTISTPTQLAQYLELWDIIQSITLIPEQPDSISWTLTSDATYSASAYNAQFFGGHARFHSTKI
ncbi:uncharacterized protein [Lolium perenne]|uniref:uncharacterized protein n=1 Tax=Lolium perenne TaxID=4522 RepID=UPI0021F5D6D9|nr:uncharacterized protein LOC127303134 [Lolium perenne]